MSILWPVAAGALVIFSVSFLLIFFKISKVQKSLNKKQDLDSTTNQAVEHMFDKDFREELRNRGRLHFEKIISENAVFLQQDLRLTTSQLNEYMKKEIEVKLKNEFSKYEEMIVDATTVAMQSIQKTNNALADQRSYINQEVQKEVLQEKKLIIEKFEKNMADIINHYLIEAMGNKIDLNSQLEHIISDLEANKQAIKEDINNGA